MNKSMVIGAVLGAAVATAGGVVAGYKMTNKGPEFAEVTKVTPITETISTPREVCHDEVVTHQRPVEDENRVAGTMIGAVVGGVLGHQVGGGKGKKLATVAGAAAGGYAGNKVQENMQQKDVYQTTERRCTTVTDKKQINKGYDVAYVIDGKPGTVRMDRDPGPRIPVRDGQLVLSESAVPAAQ